MRGRVDKTRTNCVLVVFCVILLALLLTLPGFAAEGGKWEGVDDSVVGKIATEHHRAPKPPLFGFSEEGDLMLFAFLAAGAVGGFVAGYHWRKLTERQGE